MAPDLRKPPVSTRQRQRGEAPWVLVGAKPADAIAATRKLDTPLLILADPIDGPLPEAADGLAVVYVPFKSDPLAILQAPMPDQLAGVVSFTELGLLPAALLAESMNLPGVGVGVVLRTRDKLLMRRFLRGRVPQPAFGTCGLDQPDATHYPVVVKPRTGSGSRGIRYVPDAGSFASAAAECIGWLWEEHIPGEEYSVEAITLGGRHHILGITEKHTTGGPHFIETGHIFPAPLSLGTAARVRALVTTCLEALGVRVGPSHTEVMISGDRVVLIETHTRVGGDRIDLLVQLVTGHDHLQLALLSLRQPERTDLPDPAAVSCAVAGIRYFPWQGCSIASIEGWPSCRREAGVVETDLAVKPGDVIPVWRYSHDRPGYVVVEARERSELEERLSRAIAQVRVTDLLASSAMPSPDRATTSNAE